MKPKKLQLNIPVTWVPIDWLKREETSKLPPTQVTHPISIGPVIQQRERNDGPRCTREQITRYRQNWKRILPPRVLRSIRKHNDVLHGGRSLNMLLPREYHRSTKDYDIFSKHPKPHAKEIEDYIDKQCGCDMAHVNSMVVPNVSGIEDKLMSADIHRVVTRLHSDAEVDYMRIPPGLPTVRKRGLRHESLKEALRKAKRGLNQPLRAAKASQDIQRIERYLRKRGRM